MPSDMTVVQFLTWLAGIVLGGGAIALLLERWVPRWEKISPFWKHIIIVVLTQAGSAVLGMAIAYIPAIYQNMTLGQVITGLFMAGAAYVVHMIDTWLTAKALKAKEGF